MPIKWESIITPRFEGKVGEKVFLGPEVLVPWRGGWLVDARLQGSVVTASIATKQKADKEGINVSPSLSSDSPISC